MDILRNIKKYILFKKYTLYMIHPLFVFTPTDDVRLQCNTQTKMYLAAEDIQ